MDDFFPASLFDQTLMIIVVVFVFFFIFFLILSRFRSQFHSANGEKARLGCLSARRFDFDICLLCREVKAINFLERIVYFPVWHTMFTTAYEAAFDVQINFKLVLFYALSFTACYSCHVNTYTLMLVFPSFIWIISSNFPQYLHGFVVVFHFVFILPSARFIICQVVYPGQHSNITQMLAK